MPGEAEWAGDKPFSFEGEQQPKSVRGRALGVVWLDQFGPAANAGQLEHLRAAAEERAEVGRQVSDFFKGRDPNAPPVTVQVQGAQFLGQLLEHPPVEFVPEWGRNRMRGTFCVNAKCAAALFASSLQLLP